VLPSGTKAFTPDEIEATLSLGGKGVYVGSWRDRGRRLHYLRHDGPEHVAAMALLTSRWIPR
jgi:hypothetical protein